MIPDFPPNTPWCLATSANTAPSPPPPAPAVDISQPLQVWAGPLAGGDVAVLLLNIGNGTKKITASWDDVGLKSGVSATASRAPGSAGSTACGRTSESWKER